MQALKTFASDNNAGTHPDILRAINLCNNGHAIGYGDDQYTDMALKKFNDHFGDGIDVYFVYGGTGANVLGLKAITQPYNSIICADTAHINVDECGAPEKFTGCKIQTIPSGNGKIVPSQIELLLHGFGFPHHSQPKVISITQPTELGTIYTVEEIKDIAELAHNHGLLLHMDGARISNAAAYLKANLKDITVDAGVDVLSFGGTKNGMMFGEAVIFFNKTFSIDFKYIRKQGMQLHSKMRFISAQFEAMLTNDLWLLNAQRSNSLVQVLAKEISQLPRIKITQPVQTNAIFSIIPAEVIKPLQKEYFFYVWDENKNEVRWMTSFDTEESDIFKFVNTLKKYLS
ncbi:MAG: low specificity L-threonine aldolase [Thermodesulfobacteriota bacterium]|nr:low specificity L-threonine aldolase [Thermodesulfobacteriota bacterium]